MKCSQPKNDGEKLRLFKFIFAKIKDSFLIFQNAGSASCVSFATITASLKTRQESAGFVHP